MKRVLQIGFSPNYGGVETFLMNYYRYIDRNAIQFDFINPYDQLAFEDEIQALGGKIIKTECFYHKPIRYYRKLKEICTRYDVVHVHMLSAANLLPLYAAKRAGVKRIIVHSHNTETEDAFRKALHTINRKGLLKLADVRLACSKDAGRWLFGKRDFRVLNNAVDVEEFRFSEESRREVRKEWGVDSNTVVIGHVGRLNMQKNHKFLINIFRAYHQKNTNSKLVLVGIGELESKIKSQVNAYKLQKDVLFLGKRLDVSRIYNGFDWFVMPSLFEGLPVVLVEAETNGLLCLVSANVPDDCRITSSVQFLSLQDGAERWAEKMEIMGMKRNEIAVDEVRSAGFDVKMASASLERIYDYA